MIKFNVDLHHINSDHPIGLNFYNPPQSPANGDPNPSRDSQVGAG